MRWEFRLGLGMGTTAALGVVGALEVLFLRATVAQWRVLRAPGPESLTEALTLVALAVATALGAWLAVTTVAALLAHLPGRLGEVADRWSRAWAPALSRRVAAAMVGAALGASLTPGTALGDGSNAPLVSAPGLSPAFTPTVRGQASAATPAPDPVPGWTPSRPVQRPQPASGLVTGASSARPAPEVVVHRGDTLWDIVRRQLGPGASDAEVADAWPAWHLANRTVIGEDPGLILPGQVLRPPSPSSQSSSPSASLSASPSSEPFGVRR